MDAATAFFSIRNAMEAVNQDFWSYCEAIVEAYPHVLDHLALWVDNPVYFYNLCWIYYNTRDTGYDTDNEREVPMEVDENSSSDESGYNSEGLVNGLEDGDCPIFCVDCDSENCTCNPDWFSLINSWPLDCEGNGPSKGQQQNQQNGNFGTVVNNYYQNTYQGSVDMSGVSTGKEPTNTLTGLVDSAADAFATVGPFLMDQDTEEMTQLSDRVMTQRLGNSAVNTQSTVGRMIGYAKKSDSSKPSSCGDTPTSGTPATNRFYTYKVDAWTQAVPVYSYVQMHLPDAFSSYQDSGVLAQNKARHYAMKSGWRAQVQCNASNFHSGALLVFFAPEWANDRDALPTKGWIPLDRRKNLTKTHNTSQGQAALPDLGYTTPEQWTLFPHQVLNLRTGTTADIEVPYVNVVPTSDPTVHSPWTLVIAVLSPLQYTTGSSPQVDITVSIAPVEPVWNGLRQPASEGIPTFLRENASQFTTTLPALTTPIYSCVKNRDVGWLPGEIDDLISLAKIPCFMDLDDQRRPYFELTNTAGNTPLLTLNVVLTCRCLTNTMVSAMSHYFSQYRGSLNYDFLFCGSAMAKAKVLIAYTPPGAGKPNTLEDAMQGYYSVWDIGLNSTWSFLVPFISVSDWRFTQQSAANSLNADGWVTVWSLTPLTYPAGNPTTANVVVLASAGKDFSFRNPIWTGMVYPQGTDNAEKGKVESTDATSHDGQALDVDLSHTKLSFFYDRSRLFSILYPADNHSDFTRVQMFTDTGVANYQNNDTGLKAYIRGSNVGGRILRLDSHPSAGLYPLPFFDTSLTFDRTFWNLAPFTYYRADLEVTVVPQQGMIPDNFRWAVNWWPCGAPVAPYTFSRESLDTAAGMESTATWSGIVDLAPKAIGVGGQSVSFHVPWNSPQTVCSTTFSGWYSYAKLEGQKGMAPANHWGYITINTIKTSGELSGVPFFVYIRYKNMRAWVPRPVWSRPLPAGSRARVPGEVIRPSILQSQSCLPLPRPKFRFRTRKVQALFVPTFDGVHVILKKGHWSQVVENVNDFHPVMLNASVRKQWKKWKAEVQSYFISEGAASSKSSEPPKPPPDEDDVLAAVVKLLEADGGATTLTEGWHVLTSLQAEWKAIKATAKDPGFWVNFFTAVVKLALVSYLFITGDWAARGVIFLYASLAAFEWSSLCNMAKEKLGTYFVTEAPPCPTFNLKDAKKDGKQQKSQGIGKILGEINQGFNIVKNFDWVIFKLKAFGEWIMTWFKKEEENPKSQLSELILQLPDFVTQVHNYRQGNLPGVPNQTKEGLQKIHDLALAAGNTALTNFVSKFIITDTHTNARTEPVVIVLRGKPGSGKSVAAQILAQAISKFATGAQSVYSFPPDSSYFDGYRGQYCMIMDDLGQNPNGEDFKVFCQMVSTTHFVPNMASLEDKGRDFRSQVIIATTNQPQFRPVTVADPGAVERRITFDLEVNPRAFISKGGKLDLKKALERIPGECHHPFTFNCLLLDHLTFTATDGTTDFTIPSLVDAVLGVLSDRQDNTKILNTLISQGLFDGALDPSLKVHLDEIKRCTIELEEYHKQIMQAKQEFNSFQKLLLLLVSALGGVICAKAGYDWFTRKDEASTVINTNKTVLLDTQPESRAYTGVPKKKPKELTVLQLENGSPTMEFEVYVAKRMCKQIVFKTPEGMAAQTVILVKERVFIVNAHAWKSDWTAFTIGDTTHYRDSGYTEFEIHKAGMPTDLVFVRLTQGEMFKDNLSKFCDGAPKKHTELTGVTHAYDIPLLYEGQVIADVAALPTNTGTYGNCFRYMAKTRRGFCGSPLIGLEGGAKRVYGMHAAGADGIAGACLLQKSMIISVLKHLGLDGAMTSQGIITKKPDGRMSFVPRRSAFRKTFAYAKFVPDFGPAALSNLDRRLDDGVILDDVVFSKHKANVKVLPKTVHMVAREYANRVFTKLGRDNEILTVQEAILGIDGLDAMDPNTSPGLPYTLLHKDRRELIDFENGEIKNGMLRDEVENYYYGDFSQHVFQSFLKDEIRPMDKVIAGKTRVVDVASVGHCIFGRRVLGKFASKLQQRPGFEFGSAIGCNPDVNWTQFYFEAKRYQFCYDIDYSNFDASHGEGIFQVLKECFFTAENGFDSRVHDFLDSLACSTHAYGTKRFAIAGGLPSGCSATSVLNTVMNNIIIRAGVFLTFKGIEYEDFSVLAYGDDLLLASNYELDMEQLKLTMATMGYKITPADKGEFFPKTMQIEDAQFLKRKFVPDQCRPFLIRPKMETKNLEAMLSFYRLGTLKERIDSVALLAVHSGPEVYDWLFQPFRDKGYVVAGWEYQNYLWYSNFG